MVKLTLLNYDLKYEKLDASNDIAVLKPKLIILEIPPAQIDSIKKSILSS